MKNVCFEHLVPLETDQAGFLACPVCDYYAERAQKRYRENTYNDLIVANDAKKRSTRTIYKYCIIVKKQDSKK